jgi:hypothetical protein
MSDRISCPHCRRDWTPSSHLEAASPVCLVCRKVPAAANCVQAETPKIMPARVPHPAPAPSPTAKSPRNIVAWPLVAVGAAGLVVVAFLALGTLGVMLFLGSSRKPITPVQVVLVDDTFETKDFRRPEPKPDQSPVKAAELKVQAEPKVDPMPEPKPEPKLETILEVKPESPLVIDLKPELQTEEPPFAFKRIRPSPSADELIRQLHKAKEIQLEDPFGKSVARELVVHATVHRAELPPPPPPVFSRSDLAGLPMRMGLDCHLGKESAEALQFLSRKLRSHMSEAARPVPGRGAPDDPRANADTLRSRLKADGDGTWVAPEAVPTLLQMLQSEDRPMRLLLVEMLSRIKCREATRAIARRATFDVANDVREAAVNALRDRPVEDVREALLEGLRYPWPAAAEFAAEAFVNLREKSHVPALAKLLDAPDPAAPYSVKKGSESQSYIREIVRVNHLRNCMMCHSPALSQDDLVRAPVPNPNQPLPPAFSPAYYQAPPSPGRQFVRADITYLKQDFAVPQAVASPGVWPSHQRYDYFVRERPMLAVDKPAKAKGRSSYPQKEAVLFALRELTGEDHGDTTADWQTYLQGAGAKKN